MLQLRLNSLAAVRKAAEEYQTRYDRLNVLIINAGVMACPYGLTEDGLETQLGTNHMAHFLFQFLEPPMLETASKSGSTSRVVAVSSAGHRMSGIRFDDLNFNQGGFAGEGRNAVED